MKYVKITINKERVLEGKQTFFHYPDGFDSSKFNIIYYQNKGLDKEFAIATTDDSFIESDGLKEITIGEAKSTINEYVVEDKDLKDEKLNSKGITRADISIKRQNLL